MRGLFQNGFTPLHLATLEGHSDMVGLLLEHGASVNCRSANGLTPMHLAAQEDRVPAAKILVEHDAETAPQTLVS
jgi:ankyrin